LKLGSKVLTIKYAGAFVKKHLERAQGLALMGFEFSPKTLWGRAAKRFLNEIEGKGKNANDEDHFSDSSFRSEQRSENGALEIDTKGPLLLKRHSPCRKKTSPKLKRKRPRLDIQAFPDVTLPKDRKTKTGFLLFFHSEKKAIMEAGFFHKSTLYNEAKKRWAHLSFDDRERWEQTAEKHNARLQEEDYENSEEDEAELKHSVEYPFKRKSSRRKMIRGASSCISPREFRTPSFENIKGNEDNQKRSPVISGKKPLRTKSAYHMFRKHLVDTNQIVGKERSQFAKACSQRWHKLTPEERQKWKAQADLKNFRDQHSNEEEQILSPLLSQNQFLADLEGSQSTSEPVEQDQGVLKILVGEKHASQLKALSRVNESVLALVKKSLQLRTENAKAKEELSTLEIELVSLTIENDQRRKKQRLQSEDIMQYTVLNSFPPS